jgi:hypothetical protein
MLSFRVRNSGWISLHYTFTRPPGSTQNICLQDVMYGIGQGLKFRCLTLLVYVSTQCHKWDNNIGNLWEVSIDSHLSSRKVIHIHFCLRHPPHYLSDIILTLSEYVVGCRSLPNNHITIVNIAPRRRGEGMKIGTRECNALASKACKDMYVLVVIIIVSEVEIDNATCWELKTTRQYKNSKQKQGVEDR